MFSNLMKLEVQRTPKQAVGFYLAYFLMAVLLGGLGAALFGAFAEVLGVGGDGFDARFAIGWNVGSLIAIVFCLVVSFLILAKKSLLNRFGLLMIALLSGLLAVLLGALLGLVPAAYLTTLAPSD